MDTLTVDSIRYGRSHSQRMEGLSENKKRNFMTDTEANTSNGKHEITAEDIQAAVKNIEQRKHKTYKTECEYYQKEIKWYYRNFFAVMIFALIGWAAFIISLLK